MSKHISAVVTSTPDTQTHSTKKHLRGSSLLLAGRLLSVVINIAVQVATVRFLAKSDFGAFAYALSIVSLGSSFIVFGLDKTIARFVPLYQEQQDYGRVFGTIAVIVGTIVSLGLAFVLLIYGLYGFTALAIIDDQRAVQLLLIMIILSPTQAIDALMISMFAIFASPRAIFFRKHLLDPGLKLIAVLLVIVAHRDVVWLAGGYLIAGVIGIGINATLLMGVLRKLELLRRFSLQHLKLPVREVFAFSIPVLITDLVFVLTSSLMVILLGYFHDSTDVAAFRAVLPVARVNMIVMQSFTFLFTPLATRLFARNDDAGLGDLYWQTALWIALLSFPLFALSFSLASPVTVLMFGAGYADSATILAILAFAHYFNAALGFNGLTLRVLGKVRPIIIGDGLAAVASVGLSFWLIPAYGALGAAMAMCATLVAQNVFYHASLRRGTQIMVFRWEYVRAYLIIALGVLVLLLVQSILSPPIYIGFVLVAAVSLLIIMLNRKLLHVEQTFPEVLRLPLVGRLLGHSSGGIS